MLRSFKRTPALGKCCELYARHIAGIVLRGSTELGEWTFQPTGEEFLVDLTESAYGMRSRKHACRVSRRRHKNRPLRGSLAIRDTDGGQRVAPSTQSARLR